MKDKVGLFNKYQRIIDGLILMSVALIVYHNWLYSGVVARTDLFLPSGEWLADYLSSPQLWDEEGGGRALAIYEAQDYLYSAWALLNQKMGISIDLGRRLIWIVPFFLGLYSMYSLSMLLFQDRTCAIISAAYFVASNMTVFMIHASWIQGAAGLSLTPFVFALLVKGLLGLQNETLFRNSLLAGLVLSAIFWFDMKIALLTYGLVISFVIFHTLQLLFSASQNNPRSKVTYALRLSVAMGIIAFIPVALNLYTVLPHVFMESSGSPATASQPAYVNIAGRGSLICSLLLTYVAIVDSQQVFLPFLAIISITAFSAVLLRNRCSWVIFLSLSSVILMFLSKHTAPPLAEFNVYLYKYIPGFAGFRDPTKFLMFQSFYVSLLLGVSVAELRRRLSAYSGVEVRTKK